jgi:hypothetical protein
MKSVQINHPDGSATMVPAVMCRVIRPGGASAMVMWNGVRPNPLHQANRPSTAADPEMFPATVLVREPDGTLRDVPCNSPDVRAFTIPEGVDVMVPLQALKELVQLHCRVCPSGRPCRCGKISNQKIVGGATPFVQILDDVGVAVPMAVDPALEARAPLPVSTDDLHARVMSRLSTGAR